MIAVEELLQPISEDKPSGVDLRYDPIYDTIKEARRADDELNQGAWQTERKVADYVQVIALTTKALKKDQGSADGRLADRSPAPPRSLPGLLAGLQLFHGLLDKFWDTLYPESTKRIWNCAPRRSSGSPSSSTSPPAALPLTARDITGTFTPSPVPSATKTRPRIPTPRKNGKRSLPKANSRLRPSIRPSPKPPRPTMSSSRNSWMPTSPPWSTWAKFAMRSSKTPALLSANSKLR